MLTAIPVEVGIVVAHDRRCPANGSSRDEAQWQLSVLLTEDGADR